MSDSGACLELDTTIGMPADFDLAVEGADESRRCQVIWVTQTRVGIQFRPAEDTQAGSAKDAAPRPATASQTSANATEILKGQLLSVRAALDEVPVGIVLLDSETRAQFINRAFRRMWRLPDEKADQKPPYVALMYHARDTRAFEIPDADIDAYVARRVAMVKSGDATPFNLRLANGEVVRLHCTVLPSGGRMLCYTYVTDIVRYSDEMKTLRDGLDEIHAGIVLLDRFLNVQFINRPMRELWGVSQEDVNRRLPFVELVGVAQKSGNYAVPNLRDYMARRIAMVRNGDPTPVDIPHGNGRTIRAECNVLPNGGRMITYNDVTDLIRRVSEFEQLANTDGMTGVCNRRQFDVLMANEWERFQRYQRPLSLMLIDIDHFKDVNDRFGHEVGDKAIKLIADACAQGKRGTDIVARMGGDEFAMLLPETALPQAQVVARRIRDVIDRLPEVAGDLKLTVSIGIAPATLSMSGPEAFSRSADKVLYEAKTAGRNCTKCAEDPARPNYRSAAE